MAEFVPFKKSDKFQFNNFLQIPRSFFNREEYKILTPNAIVLFCVLADRLKMSFLQMNKKSKIQFYDAKGNMYIIFKRDEIQREIHISRTALDSAIKLLKECNLIKEINQGRNLPNKIYVGKTLDMIENEKIVNIGNVQNQHSGMHETYTPECTKSALHNSYNNINKNNLYKYSSVKNKNGYEGRTYTQEDLQKLYANK